MSSSAPEPSTWRYTIRCVFLGFKRRFRRSPATGSKPDDPTRGWGSHAPLLARRVRGVNAAHCLHNGLAKAPPGYGRTELRYLGRTDAFDPRVWCALSPSLGRQKILTFNLFIFPSAPFAGLMILLDERSKSAAQIIFPLLAGCGIGMNFHAPYQVFQAALGPEHLATATSAFFLVRFTGATIGLVCRSF